MASNESQIIPEAIALPDAPTDGITCLSYLGEQPLLASTSWDGTMRVHDTATRQLKLSHGMEIPLLSLAVPVSCSHGQSLMTGGIDGTVRKIDMETSAMDIVGRHETETRTDKLGCSCLSSLGDNVVASAGWHRKLHIWDTRQSECTMTLELPGKAFSMDVTNDMQLLAVATSGRRSCFIDVRRGDSATTAELVLDRESSLKYQTRCLRFFPDGKAIAISSIEGRAAVEYLSELGRGYDSAKKYAFKCHRVGESVYPVNAIAFHPILGTFATGGCEGTVGTSTFSSCQLYL